MKVTDSQYRDIHGVVPEIDFVNFKDPFVNILQIQPQLSRMANFNNNKGGVGKTALGFVQSVFLWVLCLIIQIVVLQQV